MNKPTEIVTWTGRRSPTTGKRKTTYTVNNQRFSNIEDARKAKRSTNLDPYANKPLPNIFEGPVPTMDKIMPALKRKKERWGGKSHKKKGGVSKKNKTRKQKTNRKKQ